MPMFLLVFAIGVATLGFQGILPVAAQTFPASTVKLIVAVPPGGVADVLARLIGTHLQDKWKQTVVVENRVGGNTGVAALAVSRSEPDGLTMLVTADSTFTSNPPLFSNLSYDPKAFTPIAVLGRVSPVLVVHPSVPAKTAEDFLAYAKANPKKLTYASMGQGTYAHLAMEDLKKRTSTEFVHVPYRGSAQAINDLVAGHVSAMLINFANVESHVNAGRLRVLAAATERRLSMRPEIPMIGEAAVPGFHTSAWFGL